MDNNKPIVISLGGSLIVPDAIDVTFLDYFKRIIEVEVQKTGRQIVIITGGGATARRYQRAAKEVQPELTDEDLDWIGIYTTRMNARFVYHLLKDITSPEIITDPLDFELGEEPVMVGAGWKPGWSSDNDAVEAANTIEADTVINLSNVDAVYSDDPKENPSAEKLDRLSWDEYRKLIPKEWSPGLNTPFDPIASKHAQEYGLKVVIMGRNLSNLESYLAGEEFEGSVIS